MVTGCGFISVDAEVRLWEGQVRGLWSRTNFRDLTPCSASAGPFSLPSSRFLGVSALCGSRKAW